MLSQLRNLGLSEKEARVYLASLELGPSAVQPIARKAGVNRPTTYVMIESLIKRGLMSSFVRGKKRFFTAESPERLLSILRIQEKEIEEKERELMAALPELKALESLAEEKPRVRFFEGLEGLKAIQEDILKTETKTQEEFTNLDRAYEVFPPGPYDHRHKMAEKLKTAYSRSIAATREPRQNTTNVHYIPLQKYPFEADLVLYGTNKTAIFSLKKKLIGVIIESKEITQALRSLFELAWRATSKNE